ncbi:MAG TPA: ABC transporter permease [Symbiobacteriaceae bacterium]|nr:ABC transporter permease [Symbiobacteriaceae bacterium]
MKATWDAIWAVAVKDWLCFSRQPFLIAVSVVMPLVFLLLYAIIVPASNTNPVVVALDDSGPAGQRFLAVMREIGTREGPFYEIVTTDPATARRQFASGQALGMVVIPAGFGTQLAESDATVELHLHNINSDYSKNLRLRLDLAVRQFSDQLTAPSVLVDEVPRLSQDPKMQDYISTSLLLFAVLYSAMMGTGLHVTGEWNDRTIKELLLAPQGRGTIVLGKMLAGMGQSLPSVGLVLALLYWIFGFYPTGSLWSMAGLMAVVMVLGAGLGALFGVAGKSTLVVTSLMITTSFLIFFLSGNEDSVRGLAWGGPLVGLWYLARLLPTTYGFLVARTLLLTGDAATLSRDLILLILTTAAIVALAAASLRRAYSQLPGGQ